MVGIVSTLNAVYFLGEIIIVLDNNNQMNETLKNKKN